MQTPTAATETSGTTPATTRDPNAARRDPEKGYVALLGWAPGAVDAVDRFDRRYVVVAPD